MDTRPLNHIAVFEYYLYSLAVMAAYRWQVESEGPVYDLSEVEDWL